MLNTHPYINQKKKKEKKKPLAVLLKPTPPWFPFQTPRRFY
jgi:hypothetical protein